MSIVNKLISVSQSDHNLVGACKAVLNHYTVKGTQSHLKDLVSNHVDYPGVLTLIDTLAVYGIRSAAIRKGNYGFPDFETPFICAIQLPDWPQSYFTLIRDVSPGHIDYLDPIKNVYRIVNVDDFNKMEKDIVLLLDGDNKIDELNFEGNKKQERKRTMGNFLPFFMIFAVLLFSIVYSYFSIESSLSGIMLLLLNVAGVLVCLLLIWYDIDAHNPFLKEVCGSGQGKLSCNAVLGSAGASIFGVSWSVLGLSYFTSLLLSQLLFGLGNSHFFPVWTSISLLALPYIFYSVYYQWQVVRQWCPLCLVVQALLLLSGMLSLFYILDNGLQVAEPYPAFTLLLIGFSVLLLFNKAVPLLKDARESKAYERKWKRLRYNPDVFNMLLRKELQIELSVQDLGIVIGDPNAKHEVIKVCNPYCGPCSKAHPELEVYYGEMQLPQLEFGKIKIGQEVMIKVRGFQYQEYGYLKGRIQSISDIPIKDSLFLSKVSIERTPKDSLIRLRPRLLADVEIITEEQSILKRIWRNLTKNFYK
ncbi:vitamin K epoxide reductase family protein [Sphingobacterium spiritivorum]|uniref:vitamin K epoxide reductase family protein n=1 Tax=Sphingobacterium spiritivorum TaxID=258 RepID=UPI003DA5FF6F